MRAVRNSWNIHFYREYYNDKKDSRNIQRTTLRLIYLYKIRYVTRFVCMLLFEVPRGKKTSQNFIENVQTITTYRTTSGILWQYQMLAERSMIASFSNNGNDVGEFNVALLDTLEPEELSNFQRTTRSFKISSLVHNLNLNSLDKRNWEMIFWGDTLKMIT